MTRQFSKPLTLTVLALYFIIAIILFVLYGLPSLEGEFSLQMYSDSITYHDIAKNFDSGDELISIGANFLGPVILLKALSFSKPLIFAFNLAIVTIAIALSLSKLQLHRPTFILGILSSPLLLFSTFGVNKEVFLLPYCVLMLIYLEKRKLGWLLLSIVFGAFVRWQIVVFSLLVAILSSRLNPFHRNRYVSAALLLAAISIAYPILASGILASIETISIEGAISESGSDATGMYAAMQEIQRSYGYFLVVAPKTLQLLIGFLSRFNIELIREDFWNYFVIMLQCLQNLVLIGLLVYRKSFSLDNNCLFLILLFSIMFALTPVFAPRYFFPVSIWMVFLLSLRPLKIETNTTETLRTRSWRFV